MLQEVFIHIFQQLHKYEFRGSFEGWISKIAVRTCINFIKSKVGRWASILDREAFDDQQSTEIGFIEKQTLSDLVAQLPHGMRTVFNLFVVEGYDHCEISSILGISESNSRAQLSRARGKLKILFNNSNLS